MADIRGLDTSTTPNTWRALQADSTGVLKVVKPFSIDLKLTRPSNTNTYTIGDLINSGPVIACATTDTSATVTPSVMRGIYVGMACTGTGIPASTKVATVGTTTITLDKAATATAAAESLTFAAVGLLPMSFVAAGGVANQFVQISSAVIKSSYGAATLKLAAQVWLYKLAAMQASCADEVAFAPTFALHEANCGGRLDDVSISAVVGASTTAYDVFQSEVQRICQLDANACLYPAIVANNAYVGASAETITLTLKGFLL